MVEIDDREDIIAARKRIEEEKAYDQPKIVTNKYGITKTIDINPQSKRREPSSDNEVE